MTRFWCVLAFLVLAPASLEADERYDQQEPLFTYDGTSGVGSDYNNFSNSWADTYNTPDPRSGYQVRPNPYNEQFFDSRVRCVRLNASSVECHTDQ